MFFKAVDWCVKANDSVIETSLVGLVLNGLSHLAGVTNRLQFGVALVRGLGGNLIPGTRENFAKEVSCFYPMYLVLVGLELVRGVSAGPQPSLRFLQLVPRPAGGLLQVETKYQGRPPDHLPAARQRVSQASPAWARRQVCPSWVQRTCS